MSKIEYILCAAIHYNDGNKYEAQPINIQTGYVFCGRRHHNCIVLNFALTGTKTRKPDHVQGFLTSKNRFVDRNEAGKIAFEAGQIPDITDMLISEQLY